MVPGVHDFRKETSNVYRNLISPEDLREQLKVLALEIVFEKNQLRM